MNWNWLLVGAVIANLTFSTIGDICAKLWGSTGSNWWLWIGLAINLLTIFFFMVIVRTGGLAISTTIVLLLTIIINVSVGYLVFHEGVALIQWVGIVLGLLSILLVLNVFSFKL